MKNGRRLGHLKNLYCINAYSCSTYHPPFAFSQNFKIISSVGLRKQSCPTLFIFKRHIFFNEIFFKQISEVYSEPCLTSKVERLAKTVRSKKPLTIFSKRSMFDIWQGTELTSEFHSQYFLNIHSTHTKADK